MRGPAQAYGWRLTCPRSDGTAAFNGGFIVQSTGVFTAAFVLAGSIALIGVIAVIVFVRPIEAEPMTVTAA